MAIITGSSTIDWSGVALDHIDVQQNVDKFSSRFNQVKTEFENQTVTYNSNPNSTTFLSVTLSSGENVILKGSGFNGNDPIVKSVEYSNTATGEVESFTGTIALHFVHDPNTNKDIGTINSIRINSLTISNPVDPTETIIGNIVVDPLSGNASGSITQLKTTLGSDEVTIKGSLVLSCE